VGDAVYVFYKFGKMNKKLIILAIYITILHAAAFWCMSDQLWKVKQDLSNQMIEMFEGEP
jgi:hypothetical protein